MIIKKFNEIIDTHNLIKVHKKRKDPYSNLIITLCNIINKHVDWKPISEYPKEEVNENSFWGPNVLAIIPPGKLFPYNHRVMTTWLEASCWLIEDREGACEQLEIEPIMFTYILDLPVHIKVYDEKMKKERENGNTKDKK